MELREIDLNLLVVFSALLQERRVLTVAQTLGMSQPGVSNALNRLRTLLKDDLFVRTAHGMEPTSYAMDLAAPIAQALDKIKSTLDTKRWFDPSTSQRRFTLAMTDIGEVDFLPELSHAILRAAPTVTINTVRDNIGDLKEEMEAGHVDLTIGLFPGLKANIFQRHLTDSQYVCVFRRGHPLDKGSLTLREFERAQHLVVISAGTGHGIADDEFQRLGIVRDVKLRIPHFASVGYLLQETDLIATVPRRLFDRCAIPFKLASVELPFKLPSIAINVFWSARYHRDPASQWLRGLLFDTFGLESAKRVAVATMP